MINKENISKIISHIGLPAIIFTNYNGKENQGNGFYEYDQFDIYHMDHNKLEFHSHKQYFTNNVDFYKTVNQHLNICIKCQKVNNKYHYDIAITPDSIRTGNKVIWQNVNQQYLPKSVKRWDEQANKQTWDEFNSFNFQSKYNEYNKKCWIDPDELLYLIIIHANNIANNEFAMYTIRQLFRENFLTTKINITNSIKNQKGKNASSNYLASIKNIISGHNDNTKYKCQINLKHLPYDIIPYQLYDSHNPPSIIKRNIIVRCSLKVMICEDKNNKFITATIHLLFSVSHYLDGRLLTDITMNNSLCIKHLKQYDEYLREQTPPDIKYTSSCPKQPELYDDSQHYINIECHSDKAYSQLLTLIFLKIFEHLLEKKEFSTVICESLDILLCLKIILIPSCKIFDINIPAITPRLLEQENIGQCHYFRTTSTNSKNNNTQSNASNANDHALKLIIYLYCKLTLDNDPNKLPVVIMNIIYQFAYNRYYLHHLTMGPRFFTRPKSHNNHHANDDLDMTHHATI